MRTYVRTAPDVTPAILVGTLALAASAGGATTKRQGPTVGPQSGGATALQGVPRRERPAARRPSLSRLHAGTALTRLSASFSRLPTLTADAKGRAKATGRLLFHGREEVWLSAVADARHSIVIVLRDRVAA
jgi:hypothetical protein